MGTEANIDLTSDIENGDLDSGIAAAAPAPAGTQPAQGGDAVRVNQREPKPAAVAVVKDTDKPVTVRDQLTAAFRAENGTPTDQAAAASADGTDRGDGRTANGQFAPKPGEAPTDQQSQPAAVQAPQGFDATQFAALPAEMQQQVARTMASVEERAARYSGYDALEQVIGPRRQAWAINGVSEAQAVNQLIALSDFAGKSPPDFVRWFAGQHGIDLTALADEGGDEFVDPAVQELRQQVSELTGQLTSMTRGQQQAQHTSLVQLTERWGAEAGEGGQPLRPYFAELAGAGAIPAYIMQVKAERPNASPTELLAEAYERACWGTPTVRTKLLAAQEAERLSERRVAAVRAEAAGSSITGEAPAPGSTQAKDIGSGSVRDTLRAAIAQHS